MGLFDKKYCDICSSKIGFFGNRKLADGNMCKDCAALLSPNLVGRKEFNVAEIKEHLAYREANKQTLASFIETTSEIAIQAIHSTSISLNSSIVSIEN